MTVVTVDVSEHQGRPVDDSYNREWFSFRLCFGGSYIDRLAKQNLAWAKQAKASGKIKGYSVYVVPQPGSNDGILRILDELDVPTDVPVMIDAEKWNGTSYQINGDHSLEFNTLAARIRKRQGDNPKLVWAYGNRGPDLEVWPRKASWLGWVVASYGGSQPDVPNLLGWQYTDGQPIYDRTDLPHSTPPFGRCDHNVLYEIPEEDVPLSDSDIQKIAVAVKQAGIAEGETVADALRRLDNIGANVIELQKQVAALSVAPVDPAVLAQQITQHLDIQVVAK